MYRKKDRLKRFVGITNQRKIVIVLWEIGSSYLLAQNYIL
jgi:hypothetical protein